MSTRQAQGAFFLLKKVGPQLLGEFTNLERVISFGHLNSKLLPYLALAFISQLISASSIQANKIKSESQNSSVA